jgi:4-aminobutyrate aminotransferase/(S)-3-amino-2-methylpropionate transaminase
MDIPSFNWPACSFPELKYPLHEFEVENKATEAASLQDVEETIIAHKQSSPVAAIIVEPIQSGERTGMLASLGKFQAQ